MASIGSIVKTNTNFFISFYVIEFQVQKYDINFIGALSAGMQKCSFCSIYIKKGALFRRK
jgi:hypothetical protein